MDNLQDRHPKVSVVITTYNYARFVTHAIESVLKQTLANYEIILVNDGSTDDTEDVVLPYIKNPVIHYHKKENGGQANAKNYGIRHSRGKYIAFLDADDIWDETKLAKQMERFENNRNVGVLFSDIRTIDPDGTEILFENPKRFKGKVVSHLYGNNFVPFSSSVVRRDIIEAHGGFDESLIMGIDYDLWLRLSLVTEFDYVSEKLVSYRRGHTQMSNQVEGRDYWARLIERRFLERHPSAVTSHMIRQCEFGEAFTRFRTLEKTDSAEALKAIISMFTIYPLSWVAFKSLIRFILGKLGIDRSEGKKSDRAVSEESSPR